MRQSIVLNTISRYLEEILLITIACVFTYYWVFESIRFGRLMFPISYDDIVYHYDSLSRLTTILIEGEFAIETILDKLHAPTSVLLSMLGFYIFGLKDSAPYIMNVVYILVLLFGVKNIFSNVTPAALRIGMYFIVLSSPFVIALLTTTHPDMGAGLFNTLTVFYILNKRNDLLTIKTVFYLSLLMSLCVIAKPTMSMFSIGIIGLAMIICSTVPLFYEDRKLFITNGIACFITCVLCLLILSPYLIFNWHFISGYVTDVFGVNNSLWKLPDGHEVSKWRMYLDTLYGKIMLSYHLYLFMFLILAGNFMLLYKKKFEQQFINTSLAILTFTAWIIPSWVSLKNPFFASTFYFLLMFWALNSLSIIFDSISLNARKLVAYLSIPISFIILVFWNPYRNFDNDPLTIGKMDFAKRAHSSISFISSELYQELKKESNLNNKTKIFFTSAGSVNLHSISYQLLKNNPPAIVIGSHAIIDEIDISITGIKRAKYIIATDLGVDVYEVNVNMRPSQRLRFATLEYLKDNNFLEISKWSSSNKPNKFIYIYKNMSLQ